jgi:hypothetical protein
VLKSDGDDLLALFPGDRAPGAAAQAAVDAQQLARRQGFALYAGLGCGAVREVQVLGRPDIEGLCVNLAARLHKLVPNEAGFIFLDAATAALLPPEIGERCRPFGLRDLKGIGAVDVVSLDWDDQRTSAATQMAGSGTRIELRDLLLSIGRIRQRFSPVSGTVAVGRSSRCELVLPSPLVSGRHVEFVWEQGAWTVRDLSRNGTWLRLNGSGSELPMQGRALPLTADGSLCLGQAFGLDAQGATTIEFELVAHHAES